MSHKNSNGSSPTATTNGTTAGGGGDLKYEARLCHVVKRADFDGYGFNLHAEKGRPGQYIGKVDDGSPAESAGLRQGDRIIEVNGTNITNETHKKVVELIKAIPNETKLLVIDPRADAAELKAAIAKSGSKQQPSVVDVNDNSKQQKVANGKDSLNDKSPTSATSPAKQQTPPSSQNNKHDVNGGSNGTKEDANNKKNANNNVDTSANKMMTNGDSATAKKQQAAPVDQIIEDTKAMSVKAAEANGNKPQQQQNGSSTTTTVTDSKEAAPKLNLNMTAAELRAQLAARKKYDPKNDVCDLRKKYEIIQKM